MRSHDLGNILQDETIHRGLHMYAGTHHQTSADLSVYAKRKIRSGDVVDGNYDDTTQSAAQEHRDPLGGVRAPEENVLAFADRAGLEFAREPKRHFGDLLIGPPNGPVATRLHVGDLAAVPQKHGQVVRDGAAL